MRRSKIFDKVLVIIGTNPKKQPLFTPDERLEMIRESVKHIATVEVEHFSGLIVDSARDHGAVAIIRGLRALSDFEFEFRMALANQRLAPEIEVVNLITREEHTFLSSTIIREIASFNGDVSSMVSPNVAKALSARFNDNGAGPFTAPVSLRD